MRRAGFRAVVVSAAAALVLTTGTEAAHACSYLGITAGPSPAGPGDQVSWTIGGIEEGAGYVVTVAGREVGRGTATTSPPTSSFPMPDFGDTARPVFVVAHVTHNHEGGPWDPTTSVQYRPPTAPAPAAPPAETVTPSPEGPPPIAGEPHGDREGAADPGPRPQRPSRPDPKKAAGRAPVGHAEGAPVRRAKGGPRPQVTFAEPETTKVVSQPHARVRVDGTSSSASERRHARIEASLSQTSPPPHPERLTDVVRLAQPERAAVEGGAAIPGAVLSALSALLVLGLAAAAVLALRGRGSPPAESLAAGGPHWLPPGIGLEARSRDLLLEAELQEMIAEERFEQLDLEHRSDVAEPACPAELGPGRRG